MRIADSYQITVHSRRHVHASLSRRAGACCHMQSAVHRGSTVARSLAMGDRRPYFVTDSGRAMESSCPRPNAKHRPPVPFVSWSNRCSVLLRRGAPMGASKRRLHVTLAWDVPVMCLRCSRGSAQAIGLDTRVELGLEVLGGFRKLRVVCT